MLIFSSGQVEITSLGSSVYIYTHNQSVNLVNSVRTVLSKTKYIKDPDFLVGDIYEHLRQNMQDDSIGVTSIPYTSVKLEVWLDFDTEKVMIVDRIGEDVITQEFELSEFIENFTKRAKL